MKSLYVLSAFAALATATSVSATTVIIDQGTAYSPAYQMGAAGVGRGVSFLANQNFSISTVGTDIKVGTADATNYVYQVFASTNGHTVGSLLATSAAFQLAAGSGYQDKAFSFAFNAGSYYIVNFKRVDNNAFGGNIGMNYVSDADGLQQVNYGPLTVVEGFEGATPSAGNTVLPLTRFDGAASGAVPEPATWAMMIGGFGLMGASMRYRRRKVAVSFA